jgi:threonine dehydratase
MNAKAPVSFADITEAAKRIAGSVVRTPFIRSLTLSEITGTEIWLKLENLQFTASFKERGAANRLMTLTPEEAARGVIAMSAGNHAQAVAYHAQRLGIAATIVMPKPTPFVKVSRTRHHAARVLLEGETLAEAAAFAHQVEARDNLVFVHPYDDPAVVAGQGTVAIEMLEEQPDLDALVVPVGGGGMVAGCVIAAEGLASKTEIVGVEVESYAAAAQALAGLSVSVGGVTLAEGIAVRDVGSLPLSILRSHKTDVMVVPERLIEKALILLIEIEKTVAEGAGSAALAAVLANPRQFAGRKVGLIISGGNIDTRVLANVLMRGLVRDGRLIHLSVEVPDRPGALAGLTQAVAELGGNIVEVQHQRIFGTVSVNIAEVELLIEVQDAPHGDAIIQGLSARAIKVRRLSHNPDGLF